MNDRFRMLPSYHYEDNSDGVITTKYDKPLREYRIYGNLDELGGLTRNLCNPDEIITDGRKENGYIYGNNIDIYVKAGTYRLSFKYGGGIGDHIFFRKGQVSNGYISEFKTENKSSGKITVTFEEDEYLRISHFGSKTTAYFYDFMLVEGSEQVEYEPYYKGYAIPVEVLNESGQIKRYIIPIDKPLNADEYVSYRENLMKCPKLNLNKGTNVITVKTTTQPSAVNYQYYK